MSEEQFRTQKSAADKASNGWKWAFLGLLIFNVLTVFYIWSLFEPVTTELSSSEHPDANSALAEDTLSLSTTIHTSDAQWLMNTYLEKAIDERSPNYRVELTDQLELFGNIEFLSFEIPFALFFNPYVMDNGNIQLRGVAVEVGRFSLPIQMVMTLFANQAEIPEFIGIDTENTFIYIYLDRLFKDYSFDLKLQTIDLEAENIQIAIYLDEGTISESIEALEGPRY